MERDKEDKPFSVTGKRWNQSGTATRHQASFMFLSRKQTTVPTGSW